MPYSIIFATILLNKYMTITEILQRDHALLENQAKYLRDASRNDPRRDFVTFSEAMSLMNR